MNGPGNAFAALLKAAHGEPAEPEAAILPEAAIERLREVAARIAAGNPYKVGDLVTVRVDAPLKGKGKPHLVIGIVEDAPLYRGEPGSWPEACAAELQVIAVSGDNIAPHLVPHWMMEPL